MAKTARRLLLCVALPVTCSAAVAAESGSRFATQVRPLIQGRCLECHSGDEPAGGLDLSVRKNVLKGGKSGRVVEAKDADASLLIALIEDKLMPPQGKGLLSPSEIKIFRDWIDDGLPWEGEALSPLSETTDRRAGFDWWSLRPISPTVPPGNVNAHGVIDAHLLASLQEVGIVPAPEAERATLIRRATFDLHGLPPTPEEVDEFLADRSPFAWERLVDRLLASPRYGEREARHWLDVARFAESHGYEHDSLRPEAWPYRDYVIDAFNKDLPYDQFVKEQIAGDALRPEDRRAIAATGFLVAGPFDEVGSKVESALMRATVRQDELEDKIGAVSQAFLGLSVQCARCHHHKFDPITQDDYHRIQASLIGARHMGGTTGKVGIYAIKSESPTTVRLLRRGDVQSPRKEVNPGSLSAIRGPEPFELTSASGDGERRIRLAKWIVDPWNPLTPRVAVNRVWQRHFGQGIVASANDFGFNGGAPSHPALLDRLADDFVRNGWSLKRLHRAILLTSAYRRSSRLESRAAMIDAENRLLWRVPPRRLQGEEARDAMLAVSNRLNSTMGGEGYRLFDSTTNAGTLYRPVEKFGRSFERRGIYRTVVRGGDVPLMSALDCPDASQSIPKRLETTTPSQALTLWNGVFTRRLADEFAKRLASDRIEIAGRITLAYRLAFGRPPREIEAARAAEHVERYGLTSFCLVLFNSNEFLVVD